VEGARTARQKQKFLPLKTGLTIGLVVLVCAVAVVAVTRLREKEKSSGALEQLEVAYPELYQELLKLPDLEERDAKDTEAMEDIAYLGLDADYKTAFELMLDEGIKSGRKYCAPLQALLWIAYGNEFDGYNPLRDFSLARLVSEAWKTTSTSENYASERWLSFDEVTDRLNSPQLIAIYMQNNFSYSYVRGEAEGVKSAEYIFNDKKGACYDHALFAAYCLKKNGYDNAWGVRVRFDRMVRGWFIGHIGCVYQDPKDNLYHCMDFGIIGYTVYGPFNSIEEAASHVCSVGSWGEAGLVSYSLHEIDLETGKYKTTWVW
jgi:hypothetical protein